MGWETTSRAWRAAQRRQEREAQRQLRELQRRAAEQAKLSAMEQAFMEVEAYEKRLEVLLSVHKEQGPVRDWVVISASLSPLLPQRNSYHEVTTRQRMLIASPDQQQSAQILIEQARTRDEQTFQEALENYHQEKTEWEKLRNLSGRIRAGDHKAYIEALTELVPLAEIAELGSSVHFTVHTAKLLECRLKVNGTSAIPTEVKTLVSSGQKVSTKAMPKGKFHELYQDYVCSCVFRVAREVFALLPVDTVLITASTDSVDSRTGQTMDQPVLSVVISRTEISKLDFEHIDPSDAMDNFLHRGDFKASRKSGAFASITPLTSSDIPKIPVGDLKLNDLVEAVRELRAELKTDLANLPSACAAP